MPICGALSRAGDHCWHGAGYAGGRRLALARSLTAMGGSDVITYEPGMFAPITLVQAIAFCCEKNEVFEGWGHRFCPFESEQTARTTFDGWVQELTRWKGPPVSIEEIGETRRAEWSIWKRHPCDDVVTWKD